MTYGADLWGGFPPPMGRDLWGYKSLVWGLRLFMYGVAVFDLWGSMGLLWLRCGTYGDLWGRCGCAVGPMGMYGAVVVAVSDLWGLGSFDIYVWGCGARPMGLIDGASQFQYLCTGLRCPTYGVD